HQEPRVVKQNGAWAASLVGRVAWNCGASQVCPVGCRAKDHNKIVPSPDAEQAGIHQWCGEVESDEARLPKHATDRLGRIRTSVRSPLPNPDAAGVLEVEFHGLQNRRGAIIAEHKRGRAWTARPRNTHR